MSDTKVFLQQEENQAGLNSAKLKTIADKADIIVNGYAFTRNDSEYTILNWLAILLENRKFNIAEGLPQRAKAYILENFSVEYKKYDVIVGYRADDSYFAYAGDFINGSLSLKDLSEAMRLGKLGEQIVLKSEKAFNALTFIEAIEAPRNEFYAKYSMDIKEIIRLYHPFHEADLSKFADTANSIMNGKR